MLWWSLKFSFMKLNELPLGQVAKIVKIGSRNEKFKRRMTDLGFIPGCSVKVKRVAPFGDPVLVSLHGYELSLGKKEASTVEVVV